MIQVRRLQPDDAAAAAAVTAVMSETFGEGGGSTPARLRELLDDDRFWLYGAFDGAVPVGGLTAHAIPMTRCDGMELFIYDIAVIAKYQRRGIGTMLMKAACGEARHLGLLSTFVPAEDEDQSALDFYRSIGGEPQAVTFFNF